MINSKKIIIFNIYYLFLNSTLLTLSTMQPPPTPPPLLLPILMASPPPLTPPHGLTHCATPTPSTHHYLHTLHHNPIPHSAPVIDPMKLLHIELSQIVATADDDIESIGAEHSCHAQ